MPGLCPGEEVGHRKSLSFLFSQRDHRAVWFSQPLVSCLSVLRASVAILPDPHNLLTYVPSLGEALT